MSVKLMTTEQIQQDLAGIHNMWSGGIPPEQQDRVNALRGELKRRGAEVRAARPDEMPAVKARVLSELSEEDLGKELRTLSERISKEPTNDDLQEQFANVRFEMRKRASKPAEQTTPAPQPQPEPIKFIDHSGTNGNGGFSTRRSEDDLKQEFLAAQAAHISRVEETMRKNNLAKVAANVSAALLSKHADPNGDDVEAACAIGVQVAQNIFAKVGL